MVTWKIASKSCTTWKLIAPVAPQEFRPTSFAFISTAAAYVLMQELRLRAAGTACARAQVLTLRERLLKLGARVMVSVRRWVIHLPTSFPFRPAFRLIACRLGAQSG